MTVLIANTIETAAGGPTTVTGWNLLKGAIHFDGTGTPTSKISINIGSLTDNGVGDYTFNFTNNFSGGNNYVTVGAAGNTSSFYSNFQAVKAAAPTVSARRVMVGSDPGAANDVPFVESIIIGTMA